MTTPASRPLRFRDRQDAGAQLGRALSEYAGRPDVVVLGLPRGGVPVAVEVARAIGAPLDVFLVRKLGVPGQTELAMGAIASGGVEVLSEGIIRDLGIPSALVQQTAARERLELDRRDALYRAGRPALSLGGRIVILVDDGLATGSTMHAAVRGSSLRAPTCSAGVVPASMTAPAAPARQIGRAHV